MGKGARNRRKRERGRETALASPEALVGQLLEVETLDEFKSLIEDRPQLLSDEVLRYIEPYESAKGYGVVFTARRDLLLRSREDPDAAWGGFQKAMDTWTKAGEDLEGPTGEIERAIAEHRPDDAIALIDEALPRAEAAGLGLVYCGLLAQRGKALFHATTGNRADNIEDAIATLESALEVAIRGDQAADLLMHLGIICIDRVRGDPAQNAERGIELLRAGLAELKYSDDIHLRTTLQTNLASAMLRRERGERSENLREGIALCEDVLQHRSPDLNGTDWAFTQINYAALLEELSQLGEVEESEAEHAYESVISNATKVANWQLAAAHHSLGRMQRITAHETPEEALEHAEEDEQAAVARAESRHRRLERARDNLEAARGLASSDPDPIRRGRVLYELTEVLAELEDRDTAIAVGREARRVLRPTAIPRQAMLLGGRLGDLLSQRGEWDEAASAFRDAVESAELIFHSRLDPEARTREAKQAGNLARWAAFAIAAAGDALGAALILENGRTRELRQRLDLPEDDRSALDALPAELRDAYLTTTRQLSSSALGTAGAMASRQLQEVLAAIRSISGFEQFAIGAHSDEFVRAVEPDWPLLYVNPTPYGTLLLMIHSEDNEPVAEPVFLEQPRSLEVLMRLLAGDAAESPELVETIEYGSYLAGASGFGDQSRDLKKDVEHVLPWIGKMLAEPVSDLLRGCGATGVTLIPCGPIGLAPLHASPWVEAGRPRYLLDEVDVRYAPSAVLASAALDRATARTDSRPSLVALANPDGSLSAADAEVEEIRKFFDKERVEIASGPAATWRFLRQSCSGATHVHLACHGRAGFMGQGEAGIALSDGILLAHRLTELSAFAPRVAVVSACQSAVVDISNLPDEVYSLSTAVLAAGSACAIASLWPVRDDTTALLMTRFYEEMVINARRPPEALRHAQLWLRDLTDPEEVEYLEQHPVLAEEFRSRAAKDDRPGRRLTSRELSSPDAPYSGPEYWAPFIAVGA